MQQSRTCSVSLPSGAIALCNPATSCHQTPTGKRILPAETRHLAGMRPQANLPSDHSHGTACAGLGPSSAVETPRRFCAELLKPPLCCSPGNGILPSAILLAISTRKVVFHLLMRKAVRLRSAPKSGETLAMEK